jgi:type I restriction-modification system DNA methylase subunit
MFCVNKKERIQKYGEVFTPQWMVEEMCDMLEEENSNCFCPETTFLEPACGDGVFVLEILRRKFTNCHNRSDYSTAISSVWAMEIQEDNVKKTIENVIEFCKNYFSPSKQDIQTINDHIIQCDSLKVMKLLNNDFQPHISLGITDTKTSLFD